MTITTLHDAWAYAFDTYGATDTRPVQAAALAWFKTSSGENAEAMFEAVALNNLSQALEVGFYSSGIDDEDDFVGSFLDELAELADR